MRCGNRCCRQIGWRRALPSCPGLPTRGCVSTGTPTTFSRSECKPTLVSRNPFRTVACDQASSGILPPCTRPARCGEGRCLPQSCSTGQWSMSQTRLARRSRTVKRAQSCRSARILLRSLLPRPGSADGVRRPLTPADDRPEAPPAMVVGARECSVVGCIHEIDVPRRQRGRQLRILRRRGRSRDEPGRRRHPHLPRPLARAGADTYCGGGGEAGCRPSLIDEDPKP